ncbi:MAG: NF038129 family PEP-CTERM protein [Acidobacteriota bacterium]|nr:NF038129 family PEP-CTERM protein [Acidobacteriota bacterium]
MYTIPRIFFSVALLGCAGLALAAPITYNVEVNTASIAGTPGSLDFNFNPGPLTSQAASLQILKFSAVGSLAGNPMSNGHVNGTLPATLIFDNGTAFNDYFEGFTFGSTLSFNVSLYGPALSSPDGTSTSGSAFAFSLFSDATGTTPVLTSDTANGFAFVVNVNLDGTTTATNFITGSSVPEPGSGLLIGVAVAFGTLCFRRRNCRTCVDLNAHL